MGAPFKKRNRMSVIGFGLLGVVLASALIYNQRSFNSYSRTYDQALTQTMAWENRLSDVLTIKGRINGVVESVSHVDAAYSFQPIEEAISDLQTIWVHHGASLPDISKTQVSMGIDMISLAAMKTSDELHRKNLDEAQRQAQNVTQRAADMAPVLAQLERQLETNRQGSESERKNALAAMNRGQGFEVSAFFVLAVAFVG